MLNTVFLIGLLIFSLSTLYFLFKGKGRNGFNTAMLVSLITLISYVLMWQGNYTMMTQNGQTIYWTRWLFYGLSCTLLMVEIAQLKGIKGGALVQLLYLTAIVMVTGMLAARDLSAQRWLFFAISSFAYVILLVRLFSVRTPQAQWTHTYITFGWTVFPIVFLFAPTGFGLLGAAVANLLYLLLDIFTKILFNIQLESKQS